jgi:hypothetical protein
VAPFVLAVVAGAALGYAGGGRLRSLAQLPVSFFVLVWIALGLQLALAFTPAHAGPIPTRVAVLLASNVVIAAWIWHVVRERRLALGPISAIACGWVLNAIVIAANGAMPVSVGAAKQAGLTLDFESGSLVKHVASNSDTNLRLLSDVIAVPPLHVVLSVGDLVLAVGIVWLISSVMRNSGPQRSVPRLRQAGA